ncbi:MAG: hypothetical protein WKG00_00280 [Polyangiaceae bacterium]
MTRGQRALLLGGGLVVLAVGGILLAGAATKDFVQGVHVVKACVGLAAAGFYFYELSRDNQRRPIAERWKKLVMITLGVLSIALYFNAFKLGYEKWYHRHDQYHYYMGAKYFPELGYDWLYRCTVIAEDELGKVTDDKGRVFDLKAEARHGDRKVRDLGATNLLIPAAQVLEEPGICKDHFAPERWEAFKTDVKYFRLEANKEYWHGMQKDHGYNPPPVWTLFGRFWAALSPASVKFQIVLASLDVFFNLGMLAAVAWAFGWRAFAVAAILWGCEGAADPYYWTGGAFLRQDWLFFSVLAACLSRKKYHALAAASMVQAALLRVFPGVLVMGWLVLAGWHLVRHKRFAPTHLRMLLGGTIATVVLVGASLVWVGKDSYKAFYEHTIVVHDRTPLTNHMGLRVVIAHKWGSGQKSGRMEHTKDDKLVDPFQLWKDMRVARYDKYKWIGYLWMAATMAAFVWVLRRVRTPWVAQALSVVWIILMAQLTNYYYGFLVCAVPLIKVRRDLELAFYGYVFVTQMVWLKAYWNDDKYTLQTYAALILSYLLIAAFWDKKKQRAQPASDTPRDPTKAEIGDSSRSHTP